MRSFAEIHDELVKAVKAGLNVLLIGPRGKGKTAVALAVARASGLQLKYFSASTLDPFADLVGIPFPVTDGDRKRLEFVRPDSVNNAELLFFDELNRAHPRVLNAVFELIQFRSINGEPLPHLRSVIAAINPGNAGYQVSELDPGLVDRFHLYLVFDGNPERDWFIEQANTHYLREKGKWLPLPDLGAVRRLSHSL
jgi:MoxR-like ATPase